MDATNSKYIVGWNLSGEIEIEADTPEQAIREMKKHIRRIYAGQKHIKISTPRLIFTIPANEM